MPPTQPVDPMAWGDYPRPSLAVDVTVLTTEPTERGPELALLVLRRATTAYQGKWDIPGAFVLERERLVDAVRRVLRDKAGLTGLDPHQLEVFDDPERDERGWVVSVAFTVAVPYAALQPAIGTDSAVRLARVTVTGDEAEPLRLTLPDGQPRLMFDHDEMVALAVVEMQERYRSEPDPDRLLGVDEFTLSELYDTHQAVSGGDEHRDTFRRRVEPHLIRVGTRRLPVGRPAQLYRHP